MKIMKFNLYERLAGIFVLVALIGTVMTIFIAAAKKGWLEPKIYFSTMFNSADGLYEGTVVQLSGMRIGAVTNVEFDFESRVIVQFYVLGKYHDKIRSDSEVQLIRPYVIGEKVLDITLGTYSSGRLDQFARMPSIESFDLMSLASGKNMNVYVKHLSGVFESLKTLGSAMTDQKRIKGFVKTIDRMEGLVEGMSSMSKEVSKLAKQANREDNFGELLANMTTMTKELNKVIPEIVASNPDFAKDIARITQDIGVMTKALAPAIEGVQGQLPQATLRLIQALDETVVTLKAMQKNVFMRSNVDEVREHEEFIRERMPAHDK